jgi:hypothetical protein
MARILCVTRLQRTHMKRRAERAKTKLCVLVPNRSSDAHSPQAQCNKHRFCRPAVQPKLEVLEDRTPAGAIASAQPIAMAIGLDAVGLYSDHSLIAKAVPAASFDLSSHSPTSESLTALESSSAVGTAFFVPASSVASGSAERTPATTEGALQLSSNIADSKADIWDNLQTNIDASFSDPLGLNSGIAADLHSGGSFSAGSADSNLRNAPYDAGGSYAAASFSNGTTALPSATSQFSSLLSQNQLNALSSGCSVAPNTVAQATPILPSNVLLPKKVASPSTPEHGSLG